MQYCKRLIIFCCALFFSMQSFAQSVTDTDVTGLWKGTMYNDTTGQFLKYEIAISEKKGKLSGFTHTYFIVDDKEYHGVKKVKISRQDGKIIVEDLELIANNYPVEPNKGVKQLDVLTLAITEGVMTLSGPFSTRRTKVYHSLTGSINVQRKSNFKQSALIPHLEELGLADDLSFVQEEKLKALTDVIQTKPQAKENIIQEKGTIVVKNTPESKMTVKIDTVERPIQVSKAKEIRIEPAKTNSIPKAAADINNRIIETIQSVNYTSDSLVLTLYDNGEVDGDTVSILMNGEVIVAKAGLSTNAVRKTIYTKDIKDSIQIVMYAENLGTLAPNTGLLIVYDGKERYEIRFSGDLKKNAAIVFRRKER
ncbi:MAG: hypothetical protein ABIR78_07295 [Ferruginibacter sp.]